MTNKKRNISEIDDLKEQLEDVEMEIQDPQQEIAELKEELLKQKEKAEEYYSSLKRNMADFDNFKKRICKEKESLHTSIVSNIIESLLEPIDNFEKALEHNTKDEKFKDGVKMIYKQLKDVMNKYGVEKIKTKGEKFDPEYHEAVMHVTDDKYGEKEIIEVLRKGYKLNGKVIRHAMVTVAN